MGYVAKLGLIGLLWLAMLPAQAGMVSTADSAAKTAPQPVASIELRRQVERQMIERGVAPARAAERVARLTDEQVIALDGRLAALPAGAGVSTTDLLLIIIIIVLLV